MLQTRNAKRPAQAAVRFAVDAVDEGLLDKGEALATIDAEKLDALLHPTFDPDAEYDVLAHGRRRVAGRGEGRDRLHRRRRGRRPRPTGATSSSCARSPRPTTSPASTRRRGSSPSEGGKASHAALVARGMGVPAVTGASDLRDRPVAPARCASTATTLRRGRPDRDRRHDRRDHHRRRAARRARGRPSEFERVLELGRRAAHARRARERRHARGRAARRASSAPRASACAAPSTCSSARTATTKMVEVILADDRRRARRPRSSELRAAAAGRLRGAVRGDGGPAGDDPPARPAAARVPPAPRTTSSSRSSARASSSPTTSTELEHTLDRVRALEETNPMLGTRGVRLGILQPEIYEMQAEAIFARGRGACGPARAAGRDHDPARRLRARARAHARAASSASAASDGLDARRGLPRRHDDRAAARVLRWPTRSPSERRLLLVRHQRPDADRARASRATTSRAGSSPATST